MTNEERFKKSVEEHCKNCINKRSDLCDIRISYVNGIVKTYCEFYEREIKEKQKKKVEYVTAEHTKPVMRRLV